jgi:hypothetical protein
MDDSLAHPKELSMKFLIEIRGAKLAQNPEKTRDNLNSCGN